MPAAMDYLHFELKERGGIFYAIRTAGADRLWPFLQVVLATPRR